MSSRTIVYKGMLVATQMRRFFIDLNDAAVENVAGAGAFALFHEHDAQLGARAPEPLTSSTTARSTRCAATSAGSRAREPKHVQRPCSATTCDQVAAHHQPRGFGLGHPGQCAGVPDHERPAARPRRHHDHARAVGPERPHLRQAPRLRRVPVHAHGAVGRARRPSRSPTGACSAPRSTATACARRATYVTRDDWLILSSRRWARIDVRPG